MNTIDLLLERQSIKRLFAAEIVIYRDHVDIGSGANLARSSLAKTAFGKNFHDNLEQTVKHRFDGS